MQEAAGYTSPHSSFGDVVMGANSNSYLLRKGTFQFEVMSNTPLHKGGFLSSGAVQHGYDKPASLLVYAGVFVHQGVVHLYLTDVIMTMQMFTVL